MQPTSSDAPVAILPNTLDDAWLTIAEAAAYTKVCRHTLRRAYKANRLRAVRINGHSFRFRRAWIDSWLEGGVQ
jgi:excisionase family DNA binding protein